MAEPYNAIDLKAALGRCGVPSGARLAVALSGGPDSLCLALLADEIADIVCLTVDHGLRPEAAAEAANVAALMAERGIEHHILAWEGEKPAANIQAEARAARYALMGAWCREHGVQYLLTAHHRDDQAETMLMRLARGSGVYGLAAMAPVSHLKGFDGAVTLVRPLLEASKEQLKATLEAQSVSWIEDPSNKAAHYDRVKIREFLANPPLEGFRADRLAATASRLRRTRDALEYYERAWLDEAARMDKGGHAFLSAAALDQAPDEIVFRGIATLCRLVGGGDYVPRMEKLEAAVAAMRTPDFRGMTLNGVRIAPLYDCSLLFCREVASAAPRQMVTDAGIWDNRFEISNSGDIAGLEVGILGQDGWNQAVTLWPSIREDEMPLAAKMALPAVFREGLLVAVPRLELSVDANIGVDLSLKTLGWAKK